MDKLKHLEFIQQVITRMNNNSFLIKGWTVTITAALFALAAKDSDHRLAYIAWFVIPVFWALDGFYRSQERQYRRLYNKVRLLHNDQIDFDMNARPFTGWRTSWPGAVLSQTLALFYLGLLAITGAVTIILSR